MWIDEMDYYLVETPEQFEKFVKLLGRAVSEDLVIAFDTETGWDESDPEAVPEDVFDPFANILAGISCSWKEGTGFYISLGHADSKLKEFYVLQEMKAYLEMGKCVWHNAKFDWKGLKVRGVDAAIHSDTMVLCYLKDMDSEVGLKPNSEKYLGLKMLTFEEMSEGVNLAKVQAAQTYRYACQDADVTLRMYNRLYSEVKRMCPKILEVDTEVIKPVAEMELEGIPMDKGSIPGVVQEMQDKLNELGEEIFTQLGELYPEHADMTGQYRLRLHAPGDLATLLFDVMGMKPRKKSKTTGRQSVDKMVLEKLAAEDETGVVQKIMEWRHIFFSDLRYTKGLADYVNRKTGKIHASFITTRVPTGRFACAKPNLQQLTEPARKAGKAPEGKYWFSADYSQIEFRLMVSMAGEKKLIDAIENGEDVHRAVYSWMFNRDADSVTKEERSFGKTLNFGLIYGMEAAGLAARTDMNESQAQAAIEKYMDVLPHVQEFIKRTKAKAHQQGFVKTLFGRPRHLEQWLNSRKGYDRAFGERSAVNTIIQGTGADVLRIAIIRAKKVARKMGLESKVRMVMTIHDEIIWLVDKDVPVETMVELARKAMLFPLGKGFVSMNLGFEKSDESWGGLTAFDPDEDDEPEPPTDPDGDEVPEEFVVDLTGYEFDAPKVKELADALHSLEDESLPVVSLTIKLDQGEVPKDMRVSVDGLEELLIKKLFTTAELDLSQFEGIDL